ncbi:DUF4097 family beta strand repeat-containing protein [Streptomyces sp. NPDC059786]|uniref:DUF4097 family beta strand repeat-containing protein n=1 Tax=Streptomyces sp. NPDC059786 TaxID=3346946 RepID=UPI003649C316
MARSVRHVRTRHARHARWVRPVAGFAVAAGLVVTVSACGADAGDDTEPDHRSFALQGRTLTVDSDDSALELVTADSSDAKKVQVTRWFQGSVAIGADPEVSWKMRDDRLVLRMKCTGVIADCSAKYRIVVPRDIAVTVRDGDGRVTARGFEQALDIRTSDGAVHVTDSSGPLTLHSADGQVTARGIDSREVRATTQDGAVRLALGSVPDLVESSSQDGSVTVELPKAQYRVKTRTSDGAVHVSVPRDDSSPHVVSVRTSDGSVTLRTAN